VFSVADSWVCVGRWRNRNPHRVGGSGGCCSLFQILMTKLSEGYSSKLINT